MAKTAKMAEVPVSKLQPYERNAKKHGPEQIEKLKASIEEFGFLTPCLIDKENNIIAGHGRVMAAKELGMRAVPCVYIEGLTEAQRRAYILADNRLGELGEWDMELVYSELFQLNDQDFKVELTGFELPTFTEEETEHFSDFDDVEKMERHYGVPYQGNKSRIADIIISVLPAGERLVDLFGGGGAITHCAMLSGKWHSFLYNDLNEMIVGLFMDAVHGKYANERRVITRDDFNELKDTDAYVKYIWSFGNNGLAYLWGKNIEELKQAACHALLDETLQDRRLAYVHFIKLLKEVYDPAPHRIASIERLQSLEHLQALNQLEALQRLEALHIDYRDFEYKPGDVVYCDVPYEVIGKDGCEDYGLSFDSKEFYAWVKSRSYQVFFSSYEISDDSFYKLKIKEVQSLIGAHTNGQYRTEYLYSNGPIRGNDNGKITDTSAAG